MSSTSWYKRYPADFLHSTSALSLEEKGAYSVALDLMYERGGPIPDDAQWIARMCGCSVRKWTQALRPSLIAAGKLQLTADGKLMNSRVTYETHESAKRLEAARASGSRGGTNKARSNPIIDPINSDDLWTFNNLAEGQDSTPADSDCAAPATELSAIYPPDKSEIIETEPNEINTPALADSGLRKKVSKEVVSLRSTRAARATRIPDDWKPSQSDIDHAIAHGVDPTRAAEEFHGYWSNRTGRGSTMVSWSRAFQNRVLVLQDAGRFPLKGTSGQRAFVKPGSVTDLMQRWGLKGYDPIIEPEPEPGRVAL